MQPELDIYLAILKAFSPLIIAGLIGAMVIIYWVDGKRI